MKNEGSKEQNGIYMLLGGRLSKRHQGEPTKGSRDGHGGGIAQVRPRAEQGVVTQIVKKRAWLQKKNKTIHNDE